MPKQYWVGLLTEAGEVQWPGYERVPLAKRPTEVQFPLYDPIAENAHLDDYCLLAFYGSKEGNDCEKIIPVSLPHDKLGKGYLISFQIP